MENVERILDAYLGPDGLIQKEGILSVLQKGGDAIRNAGEKVQDKLRSKRAISKDLSAIDKVHRELFHYTK